MSDRDVTEILDRLVGGLDDEVPDWDDVARRAALHGRQEAARRRWTLALVPAVLAAAAVVALLLAAPWSGGPNVVDRAAAAILSPTPGRVLYEDVRVRLTPLPADVRVARRDGFHVPHGLLIKTRLRIWLDGTPPQRFRLLETSQFRAPGVPPGAPTDLGGRIGAISGLSYEPTAGALDPAPFAHRIAVADIDPTALIKNALRQGRAKAAGKTSIDGRAAIKIVWTAKIDGRAPTTGAYYVDPKTYRPLRIVLDETGPFGSVLGFPIPALSLIQSSTMPPVNGQYRFDFHEYRYLPATATARRAADIRKVHPHAPIL